MNTICNGDGKVWQMLATENGTFALRYAKFSIKKRGGTGRFISKPPISVVLPKVELQNNNDNNNATTIFIDNTDIINMNGNIQMSKNLSKMIQMLPLSRTRLPRISLESVRSNRDLLPLRRLDS